uniref:PWI domain-containing protein n=1 Tax=Heterorhabditis bacteriophora TaxID=37862 RepID=A0A1I7X2Y8_HETBA
MGQKIFIAKEPRDNLRIQLILLAYVDDTEINMGDAGFFRGTSSDQDGRFSDKEKKLLKQMKFEETLERKINMDKINLDVIKPWITMRINEILGMEDDVVIEYIMSQLEEKTINPKIMQINITGFLNARRAREFMGELWVLLVEADEADDGIPRSLIDKKLNEMKRETPRNGDTKPEPVNTAASDWQNRDKEKVKDGTPPRRVYFINICSLSFLKIFNLPVYLRKIFRKKKKKKQERGKRKKRRSIRRKNEKGVQLRVVPVILILRIWAMLITVRGLHLILCRVILYCYNLISVSGFSLFVVGISWALSVNTPQQFGRAMRASFGDRFRLPQSQNSQSFDDILRSIEARTPSTVERSTPQK